MNWIKKFKKLWRWLRRKKRINNGRTARDIIFDEFSKVDDQVKQFIRSAVDVKPGEKVEFRKDIAVIKPRMSHTRLRQNVEQLRRYKQIWRQTDRSMSWKEFRAEILRMNNFSNAFSEAYGMMMDRQIERAAAFGRIYRSTGNRELAKGVAMSIDRC